MTCEQSKIGSPVLESHAFKNGSTSRNGSKHVFGSQISSVPHLLGSGRKIVLLVMFFGFAASMVFAQTTGSISGTVRDAQGAVVPGTAVQLRNTSTGVARTIQTNSVGFYNFTALPVGHYDITFQKTGFANYVQTDIIVNINTARQVDAVMPVRAQTEQVTVRATQLAVNTETTEMGEVIGGQQIVDMPLNGRAYTDLLALQPGVVPVNESQYGSLSPADTLNNGILSISGSRDVESGFLLNGANTVEGFTAGTTLIPTLDSIAQFRIITSNGSAKFGNYSGGLIDIVTKSGTNRFHGDAFEFYRNTDLDAANYFGGQRGIYHQNQFGGTVGGPILHDRLFFFVDYQGTRQSIGITSSRVLVPSVADKTGDLSDSPNFTGVGNPNWQPSVVNGPYFAGVLSSRLGYTVTAGEPYYLPGCSNTATCVFPNAIIPQAAWAPPSAATLKIIPDPNAGQYWNSSAAAQILQDDKGAIRIDSNTRLGAISGYYHDDPWVYNNPYGDTFAQFPFPSLGKAQLYVASLTNAFGANMVNVLTASYFRNKNTAGGPQPGPSLASLGYAAPADDGIYRTAAFQNYPSMGLNNYNLGSLGYETTQIDNTYQFQDDFTKVVGTHTLEFGADYHWDQINYLHVNNGEIYFNGTETGYDFADLLIGAPNFYEQGTPGNMGLRNFYLGIYGQDSWRVSRSLTFNYGVRYEVIPYWAQAPYFGGPTKSGNSVVLLGKQSTQFPTAPPGYLFAGDDGVPLHDANTRWNNFGPRVGLAWAPDFSDSSFLHTVFGDRGKTSIRTGYGMYYTTAIAANAYNFNAPPFGLFYESPAPPMLAQPFLTRSSGQDNHQRFPIPPITNPASVNWAQFEPISSIRNPLINAATPYEEHVDFSVERSITQNALFSASYVGTFGRHLIQNADQNQGDPALCLSVSQPSEVTDGVTCGPSGENGVFHPVGGGVINSTRGPLGPLFTGEGLQLNTGTSSYNALQSSFRYQGARLSTLLSYTFSKAMDSGSGFGEQIIIGLPANHFWAISSFDMTHIFAASYTYELPFDALFRTDNRAVRGWKLSGITHFTSGLPVEIQETDDRSLRGNTGNSPFSGSTDQPVIAPGPIYADRNPRHGHSYFNTSRYSLEPLGGQGDTPRRFFHGPGVDDWDLALLKDTKIHEDMMVEFRAEFFNAFNHAQFYGSQAVDGNVNDGSSFGQVNSAADPRIGQLALKYIF
jgi:hypothetical protein